MFIGIDLGTSSVKCILLARSGSVLASASEALEISNPHPLWSEQDPRAWWRATESALDQLLAKARADGLSLADIAGIGLSGQQHGAVVLDGAGEVLRPAILWNDGRSHAECAELEAAADVLGITGNLAMPGFTAPKLLWLRRHEPKVFEAIAKVLLPKDYLRWRLTGEFATDASDAAGTLWLDVAKRQWSDPLLAACGLSREQMPRVYEGSQATGQLRAELAQRWGLGSIPVAGGGGDNAAGAVGIGMIEAGQAMLSLGTSGVYFAVSDGFLSRPERAVHSFCHALPDTWHLMSVMLSAASCLDFGVRNLGYGHVNELLDEASKAEVRADGPWFMPYLSGERTPYNDPNLRAGYVGLQVSTRRADLARATLEGVSLGLLDGVLALESTGLVPGEVSVIGGGSRSGWWLQMLADVIGKPLLQRQGGDVGPALGAARLGWLAAEPDVKAHEVCIAPPLLHTFEPDQARHRFYRDERYPAFGALVPALQPIYRQLGDSVG